MTSVTITSASDASTNSTIVGNGDILGLGSICASVSIVGEEEDGAAPTAGTVVAGASGQADRFGTYDPNSALDGSLDFDLWYISEAPEDD